MLLSSILPDMFKANLRGVLKKLIEQVSRTGFLNSLIKFYSISFFHIFLLLKLSHCKARQTSICMQVCLSVCGCMSMHNICQFHSKCQLQMPYGSLYWISPFHFYLIFQKYGFLLLLFFSRLLFILMEKFLRMRICIFNINTDNLPMAILPIETITK